MNITSANSPRWANAQSTAITLTVVFEEIGEPVEFTASSDDTEAHGVELYNQAIAGLYGTIAPYVAPSTPVPSQITARQFFIQAALDGKITQAQAVSREIPTVIQELFDSLSSTDKFVAEATWSTMTLVVRSDALTIAAGAAFGLNSGQLDTFFINAAEL